MLNYEVDPELLRPLVPRETELDRYHGATFVTLVGFLFEDLRVFGVPIPWHRRFEEVNLRFYVRRRAAGQTRRGVVFIREIAPRRLVERVARRLYNERYMTLPMQHCIDLYEGQLREGSRVQYRWHAAGRWHTAGAKIAGPLRRPAPDSLEQFIVEHYWGYTQVPGGRTREYQVEHAPWNVWGAEDARIDGDTRAVYDSVFADALRAAPHSTLVAEGSPVAVRRGGWIA
jgi:hypothetical protein